ncbi:MAG TPA: hypothetical protein VHD90_19160 [Phototrophicaceae bacterium]|nr:hypothetical protein [Phototrophicaceae bacterium]
MATSFPALRRASLQIAVIVVLLAACFAPAYADSFALVAGTKTVTGTFEEGGSVTYTVILTNSGTGAQGDNPGNEFVDVLPVSLTLVSANASSGTAVATVGTNTVTWNGTIPASGGSVTITIPAIIKPGTAGQTISNTGTISYDADRNGTNESSGTTNTASFIVGSPLPLPTSPASQPPPPATPLCMAQNAVEDGVVRAGVPDAIAYAINCRVLYQNGQVANWLGGDLYNAGSIGIESLLNLGVEQAVDIFSPPGLTYFNGGAVFCLKGEGALIWLAASSSPRHADIIGSYTVPDFPGFTCATLFEPGTLVLVADTPKS